MSKELIPGPFISDNVKVFLGLLVITLGLGAWLYIKVDAYGGDWTCLFVKCIKVIP